MDKSQGLSSFIYGIIYGKSISSKTKSIYYLEDPVLQLTKIPQVFKGFRSFTSL